MGTLLWCFVAQVVWEELTGNLLFHSQKALEKKTSTFSLVLNSNSFNSDFFFLNN